MKQVLKGMVVSSALVMVSAFAAAAPVKDASATPAQANLATPAATQTSAASVATLQQQVSNLTKMNLPSQMSQLQQQVQKLAGQVSVLQHDIQLLNSQQRGFYQDLNQKIQQVSNLSSGSANVPDVLAKSSKKNDSVDGKEKSAYDTAVNAVKAKKFAVGKKELQGYLGDYPNGSYVANAHYWLGEIALQQNDRATAVTQFGAVVNHFPKSNKANDSRLKLADILMLQGQVAKAKGYYQAIVKAAPNSAQAHLAQLKLQAMQSPVAISSS